MQGDDTMIATTVETHFQMNYNTGEWKRIKKYRKIEDPLNIATPTPTQTATCLPQRVYSVYILSWLLLMLYLIQINIFLYIVFIRQLQGVYIH